MSWSTIALLVATSLYAGFQWIVRIVVYPQFAAVPASGFAAYEQRHQRLITVVVGPLFVLDGLASIAAFMVSPGWLTAGAGGCLAVVLGVTAVAAVPAHRRLSDGFDAGTYRRLLAVDTVRVAAATAAVMAAVALARAG